MSNLVLGIGEFGASNAPGSLIKTFALGSCVALMLLDPRSRSVGMVHIALPNSQTNPGKAEERPGYFADTAVPALLAAMVAQGCQPGERNLIVKLAGGACIMDQNGLFNIGQRNQQTVKELLAARGLRVHKEDLGGSISRTVCIDVSRGQVVLSSPGRPDWTL